MRTASIIVLVTSLLLSGCATKSQVDARIQPWQTASLDQIIAAWGLPTREQMVGQRRFLIWNNQKTSADVDVGIRVGSFGRHGGISVGTLLFGGGEENICSRVVEVNDKEQVIGIQWNGDPGVCLNVTPESGKPQ